MIVAHRNDDLGGKLLNCYVAHLLSSKFNDPYSVYWDGDITCESNQIVLPANFNPYKLRLIRFQQSYLKNISFCSTRQMKKLVRNNDFREIQTYKDLVNLDNHTAPIILKGQIDLLGDERAAESKHFGEFFSDTNIEFKDFLFSSLNETITSKVDEIAAELGLQNAIGVHVRRGDCEILKNMIKDQCVDKSSYSVREAELAARKSIDTERYFKVLEQFSGRKVFVCSDSEPAKNEFKKQFGSLYCDYQVRSFDRLNLFGMSKLQKWTQLLHARRTRDAVEDAYTEMLLLAKCRYIIRGASLFAKVSTMINNNFIELDHKGNVVVNNINI